jgi:ABC-type multidrug transport system fused ATPase/permease subunit
MIKKYKYLNSVLTENKLSIALIYILNIIEELFGLFIPSAVGLLINTFISGKGYGHFVFLFTYIGWQGLATIRKVKDTQIFTQIFNQICLKMIKDAKPDLAELSLVNARIELIKQVISFIDTDFPFLVRSLVSIVGSAILLFYINPKLLLISIMIILPSFFLNYFYSKRISVITKTINNLYEKQVEILQTRNLSDIKEYFESLRFKSINKSNQEAYNFGIIEIFVMAMILTSVYVICQNEKMKIGDIVAGYSIILRFGYGFDFIPYITTKLVNVRDILVRLDKI